jgi:hypothetical protein
MSALPGAVGAPELTAEDIYNFDCAGYLHLPGVLTLTEAAAAAAALDLGGRRSGPTAVAEQLLHHAAIKTRLAQLLASEPHNQQDRVLGADGGFTCKRDGEAAELVAADCTAALSGGPGPGGVVDMTRSYFNQAGHRFVHGVVVVWAVGSGQTPAGGYAVVPGSHKATAEVPADFRSRRNLTPLANLGILQQPPLRAGDVLLVSSAVLQGAHHRASSAGVAPRLLRCEFLSRRARPRSPEDGQADAGGGWHQPGGHDRALEPVWMGELTDVERVVMGLDPHRTVYTHGGRSWLEKEPPSTTAVHPSALVPNPSWSAQQQEEFFLWETCGFLILRNVMDPPWLAQANEAIEWAKSQPQDGPFRIGNGDGNMNGNWLTPLALPKPHNLPYKRMIACPAVMERLAWIMGEGFVHYGSAPVRLADKGHGAQGIHAGLMEDDKDYHYVISQNGRSYAESINCSWQLADHCPLGGGVCVVPGSHKANYLMPGSLTGAGPPPGGASPSGLACPAHFVFNFSCSTKRSCAMPV